MSTHAATAPAALPAEISTASAASKALTIGIIGLVLTALGLFVSDTQVVAMSYLVGVTYWVAMAIGFLMLVLIHHVVDASWSVVIRRQWEHGLVSFKWLALLFLPLLITAWIKPGLVWPWMDLSHPIREGTVATDVLYQKKSGFLNVNMFTGMTVAFFASWIGLSALLRKASFSQDADGAAKWTSMNRKVSAIGVIMTALTLTFAAVYWIKSLEYHWFSTMYGVWFFANCVRGGLSLGIIIMVWLLHRGDYKGGVYNVNQLHCISTLAFAFTVFWAYVTFSQYFLIWNANVPEETFWYNIREVNLDGSPNQWKYVGIIAILFGHFVVPFCLMLSYRYKTTPVIIRRIAYWILAVILIDLCYNILPALREANGNPLPFFSIALVWVLTSVIGVGGVCVWSYLKSFPTTKLIPIRDPRIAECLTHHE
jgi:hypothetical protein